VAETGAEHSTNKEIWFNDAVMLLAERSGESTDYAQELLVKGLEDGVPWSHMKDGIRVPGNAAFWRHRRVDSISTVDRILEIDRAKNLAMYGGLIADNAPWPSDVPSIVRDIKVTRWAALALVATALPSPPVEAETAPSSPPVVESETVLSSATVLSAKQWVAHAIEEFREELAGLPDRAVARRLEKWGREGKAGLRSPQKPIGRSRIRTIAVELGLLPVK
jgi:hypothetical protein